MPDAFCRAVVEGKFGRASQSRCGEFTKFYKHPIDTWTLIIFLEHILVGGLTHFYIFPYIGNNNPI